MSLDEARARLYWTALDSLNGELAGCLRRIARGRDRAEDRVDAAELELCLREVRALYRADLRIALEGMDEPLDPLDVALVQAEELLVDELPLRHLSEGMLASLRSKREADWALVVHRLDGAGGLPPRL